MKLHELREFIKLVNQSSIEELEWEKGKTRIVIKKSVPVEAVAVNAPVQVGEVEHGYQEAAATAESVDVAAEAPKEVTQQVMSLGVGLFYADVTVGQTVQAGEKVGRCTADALQLSTDITTPVSGIITEILVVDGQFVDYGKALIVVKTQ
ncbi:MULTISPECIES: biotin/lipoyl-containing protein [Brevibacillus]|uniref:acetyl-CoA carboxylase biotin carboxyl carrier protein n=1 Tax=Brevibacillus TaxID=55080 RepID=UPI000D0F32FD|nr:MULTISPECIES: biotin/lipoyl-containing protein [Brevibacillus]MED1944155.1 biotin/lipoyl-binding protein [Brevibacillus formosus]MED1999473.1 biotin/lipoyl-binding protein [Brevibacillus formosus]MED2082390.1 biotin/lipoyl-binding protein [Brevibacillus formosus]PSK18700.1 acetyl-CoA carboxylase biotin carboxyl carrier protein subunit [Brevibacillus sp. NRRL NRS-603]